MTETDYQHKIQEHIKALGGDSWKVHGSAVQSNGQPDLDAWIPSPMGSIPLKIEVKTPTGRPTLMQVIRLRDYHQSRAYLAGICVTAEDLDKLVEAYLRSLSEMREMWGVMQEMGIPDPYYIYHKQQIGEPDPVFRKNKRR